MQPEGPKTCRPQAESHFRAGQVRTALVESAWSYRYRPAIGALLRRRQAGADPATLARSWKAQQRLHATWKKMTGHGKPPGVVTTAVARELAGFVWAEMTS